MAKQVSIAYEALPWAEDYEAIRADVDRQIPLRNLHWDNEAYRATVRTQIREWLDSVTAKYHQEWLIIHVTSGKGSGAKFYQRKSAIVDKIKADFNVGKKDRRVLLQGSSADDPTAWADFLSKVKEGIIATFDSNVALYEESVRKADSQRQLSGWQFLPFFRQKEALVDSFEAMTLYEDALIQYDELEASFFQVSKEHAQAPWFRNFGGVSPGDDALPLLSTTNKPYRKLIETDAITIFDFRIYLFARQTVMLFHLGRVVEVARRGAYFVSTFARKLREYQSTLGPNFVEAWTYSACLNIVSECGRRIDQDLSDPAATGFVAVKAELLELAKKQLDKLGMGAGHLPSTHPFSMSFNEPSASIVNNSSASSPTSTTPPNRQPVTRKDLVDAIDKREAFDKLYVELTQRSLQAYQASGRKRCAAKLHACLAALEQCRERLPTAQKLFSQLPTTYTDLRWTTIESYLLSQCTSLQESLEMPKDRLLSTLALVRSGVTVGSKDWGLEPVLDHVVDWKRQNAELAKKLMDDVYQLSATLSKGDGGRPVDEDGVTATVLVRNALPCDVRVDEVRLKLATTEGEQVWLTASACTLAPGETPVSVFCPTSVTGRLTLELSQLRFSRIIFQYSHRPVSTRNLAPDPRQVPVTDKQSAVFLPPDQQAVHVFIEEPRSVHLDRERMMILGVDPGRNTVSKITVRLAVAGQDVHFATTGAEGLDGVTFTADADNVLALQDLTPYTPVRVVIPLTGNIVDPNFSVAADYMTSRRPHTRRSLRRTMDYSVALPLAVNVQDYFREDCLLSKFSVTTDGVHGLKVESATISASPLVRVNPCRAKRDVPVIISPLQTANFLFKMQCYRPTEVQDPLRLVLTYASIEERLRSRVSAVVNRGIDGASLREHGRWVVEAFLSDALASTDLERYCSSESLDHLTYDEAIWKKRLNLCMVPPTAREPVLSAVQAIYKELRGGGGVVDTWRTLEIPLDLPALHVLNLVEITPALSRTEVGQLVPATLTIRPTFRWSRTPVSTAAPIRLAYSVVANASEWIISGRAKDEWIAQVGEEVVVQLGLVPLRAAALFVPSVVVQPVQDGTRELISCETQHVTAATAVEVLPITHRTTFEIAVPLAT
ncbi:transmembrane protein [Rhodotorula toruloides]|uniref:Transmembrane protein n=1 Tax=Rhodotorula toruloides TaxID=5286 RepID=A0A511KIK9_RHOTO|nr:transmembrane protein [Rhodotorula toruloides]